MNTAENTKGMRINSGEFPAIPFFDLGWVPFKYESIVLEEGRRPVGFRFSKVIFNIIAKFQGREIVATGEGDDRREAYWKVFSETMERSALIQFHEEHRAETSNGWAGHPERDKAKTNAIFELVERDAVLAQWYTSTPFRELGMDQWPSEIQYWAKSELAQSEFPEMRILLSTEGLGPSVTVLFVNKKGFGVSAHATRSTLSESIKSAIAEACRPAHASIRKQHWKKSFELKLGLGDRTIPDVHALYYAYHEPFPAWIFGKYITWSEALGSWHNGMTALDFENNQFSFTVVLESPVFVGYAKHPNSFELRWGTTDAEWVTASSGWQRIKNKPSKINKNVHIVA